MYHQALSRRDFLGCVLGSSALGAAGCTIIGGPKSRPNIVLAVMDTVRADHVTAWGYHRKTTPHLDGLLGHATKFTRVQAPAPYTLPSHASMFTGRWPSEHGADSQRYVNEQQEPHVRELPLRGEFLTLAERLQQAGYATGAFAANTAYLKPRFNVLQGFETQEIEHIPGVRLVERAIPWVTAQKGPFFLFLNLMDAHRPYNLEPRPGTLEGPVPDDPELLNRLRHTALPGDKPLDPELVRQVTAQYDTGVANADAAVGKLLAELERAGLSEDAYVVVTSDHGEFLGEHHLVEHSKDVYQPVIHVPLAVKAPGQMNAETIDETLSLIQLFSTLLMASGLEAPVDGPPSLFAPKGNYPVLAQIFYSRDWDLRSPVWGHRFERVRHALYEDQWKYIYSTDGKHEIFDLSSDPDEGENLLKDQAGRAQAMQQRLAAHIDLSHVPDGSVLPNAPEMTEQEREHMKSLGYLGD